MNRLPSHLADRAAEFFAFEYAFTVSSLMASTAVGLVCGALSTILVLRGLSLLGDAMGHATLPGVCLGFLAAGGQKVWGWLFAGAMLTVMAGAGIVALLSDRPRTRNDATIGIVLSVFFGFGIVLLSGIQASPTGSQSGLDAFLLGNAAGVSRTESIALMGLALLVLGALVLFHRVVSVATFDPIYAASIGLPEKPLHWIFLALLSVVVVSSLQAVGVVLVAAMLIIPGSTALLVSRKLTHATAASATAGALAGALGAFLSFAFEGVGTGPAMTLVAAFVFFVVLLGSRARVVVQRLRAGESL